MEQDNPLRLLAERSPIGWLRERDIDLLICSELHVDGPLRRHLADALGVSGGTFVGAWVSHNDLDGESDLIIVFREDNELLIAMAENKVAADFQPDQVSRYRARASRWQAGIPASRVIPVLLAPSEYLGRDGSDGFDVQIPYERLADCLRSSPDPRSIFLADALLAGIDAYRRGYTAIPNQAVTDVWTAIWRIAQAEAPNLKMQQPSSKPGRSSFVYFRRPNGFGVADVRRVDLVLKAAHGNVDLQFKRTSPEALERALAHLLEDDMTITRAAGSASIRISVPCLDFGSPPDAQHKRIRQGLLQAERLRKFFVEKQPLTLLDATRHPM